MEKSPRPCTSQVEISEREVCRNRAVDGRIVVKSRGARIPKRNKRRTTATTKSQFSGAELPPFQAASLGAGGTTAVVGLFESTLRLGHDFARFR
jgi:hypothetical protein